MNSRGKDCLECDGWRTGVEVRKWDEVSNGKVNVSLILAVFVMGSHHFLWGRILKTGDDCKEDGGKRTREG